MVLGWGVLRLNTDIQLKWTGCYPGKPNDELTRGNLKQFSKTDVIKILEAMNFLIVIEETKTGFSAFAPDI